MGNKQTNTLVDTGASVIIVSTLFFEKLEAKEKPQLTSVFVKLTSASGDDIPIKEKCPIEISFNNFQVTHEVLVADITNLCILGLYFMTQN